MGLLKQMFCLGEPEKDASGSSPKRGRKLQMQNFIIYQNQFFNPQVSNN